ncbi:hypothetical protein COT51_02450 [candidate division WWE3 bacterium CG08_land_8_20_14_0_20_41_15]|uniref:Type II secretion system protein GspG C-terminal domain-containing protein n=1 Tax=candidate division WWE3 bacterium CG08_land_8_20_14_0_20_41_15 TaxID=1975086 RepID=A0A2H0XBC6_UNCKA|nr:MAG: hypothetical protein COT51_02450 [candidate division WWE3 bacterium CG08_land_8_20_14_0_20_41_15]
MKIRFLRKLDLVELLMYVALFGALGLTVFVSRDPLEQIARADDVDLESESTGLAFSLKQYYKQKRTWPWPEGTFSGTSISADDPLLSLNILVSSGFLEQKFLDSPTLSHLQLRPISEGRAFEICFVPKSKEFKKLADCDINLANCYYCTK